MKHTKRNRRELAGKVILITGGSSGIGAATAIEGARCGMNVVLGGRNQERLAAVCEAVQNAGGVAVSVAGDVADPANPAALLDAAHESFGGVDVVFANAGYGVEESIYDMTEDALRRIFEVNFFASVALAREAATRWIEAGEPGHIFFCASCLSKFTMSYYGAYAATKSAQAMVARAMRFELGEYDIEVASVHPVTTETGFFATVADASGLPLTDEGLPAHAPRAFVQPPEQVARAVLKAIRRPRSEVWTSPTTKFASAVFTQFPWVLDLVLRRHTARELARRANRS